MILNDTLQTHRDCLEQCELKREVCHLDQDDTEACDVENEKCILECDFDYGP